MRDLAARVPFRRTGAIDWARLQRELDELAPVGIKIGQHLSVRPDLVSMDVAQRLLVFTDRVPSTGRSQIDDALAEDLHLSRQDLGLEAEPIAAGSLAEVYRGRAPGGAPIAVKVKRPRIDEAVAQTFADRSKRARIARLVRSVAPVAEEELIEELRKNLIEELKFDEELRNLERMYQASAGNPMMSFPKPYPELSSGRIVTMEFFKGVALTDLIKSARDPSGGALHYGEIDRSHVAANLVWSALDQIFNFETFHADLHPGNIIILPGNIIGFVDLGLVGSLSARFRAGLASYLRAIYEDDTERMLKGALGLLQRTDRADPEAFRAAFMKAHEKWSAAREDSQAGMRTGLYMIDVLKASKDHGFQVPRQMLSLYRSLITAELIATEIAPEENLSSVGPQFFREQERSRFFDRFRKDALLKDIAEAVELLLEGPGRLSRVLEDFSQNRVVLRMESSESPAASRQSDLRAKLVSTAILFVALAILFAGVVNTKTGWSGYGAGGLIVALIAVFCAMVIHWRRLKS